MQKDKKRRWIIEKQSHGWSLGKINRKSRGREERAEKQRAQQRLQDSARKAAEAERLSKNKDAKRLGEDVEKRTRFDSPQAIKGQWQLNLDIKGMGTCRIRLNSTIPNDATVQRVILVKEPGHESALQVRLVMTVPRRKPELDQIQSGERIHAAVRHLSPIAPPLAYVEAVRAAGIPVRGDDAGIAAPSCDDTGATTERVKRPRREVEERKALQRSLAHKATVHDREYEEQCKEKAEVSKGQSKRNVPNKRRKRTRSELRLINSIRVIDTRWKNTGRTRACQDASSMVRSKVSAIGQSPILVATDPRRMVAPLLAKGGPVERRANAEKGNMVVDAKAGFMSGEKRRRMRENLHRTRIGLKIERVGILCDAGGAIHATPGHEGTSQGCPGCAGIVPKTLAVRRHECPHCGFSCERDHASALMTLGRALREYRDTPDPGGRVIARRQALLKRDDDAAAVKRRRRDGARKSRDNAGRSAALSPSKGEKSVIFQTETLPTFALFSSAQYRASEEPALVLFLAGYYIAEQAMPVKTLIYIMLSVLLPVCGLLSRSLICS